MWNPSKFGCDLHVSSPVSPTGSCMFAARRGHVQITPDIDFDAMKYKGSLIFGSAYTFLCVTGCASIYILFTA